MDHFEGVAELLLISSFPSSFVREKRLINFYNKCLLTDIMLFYTCLSTLKKNNPDYFEIISNDLKNINLN
jgi:hypothetical protein